MENSPQLALDIDRDKANALGVSFEDINTTLSTAFGSNYVNDFDSNGRQQRVIVQLDATERMTPDDFRNLYVRNASGTMVPFSAFSSTKWANGPIQLIRYNGYPAMRITGTPAEGYSTGDAMNEMVSLMRNCRQDSDTNGQANPWKNNPPVHRLRCCMPFPCWRFSFVWPLCMKAPPFRLPSCWSFRWALSAP